ncbi:MAG: hypothetical protein KDA22_09120 [Phycisphaerales bacterium]|nr:hypothetical protein [Phycisphaerales bacterium]
MTHGSHALLAWIPFLDPLYSAYDWWPLLIVPLCFGIAMIYKAYRLPTLDRYWRQVVLMTVQALFAFAGLAAALFLLVQVIVPMLPAE